MINASEIYSLQPHHRRDAILSQAQASDGVSDDVEVARILSDVIDTFISEYIDIAINHDSNNPAGSVLHINNLEAAIDEELQDFLPVAIQSLQDALPTTEALVRSSKNIYELSGAVKLSFANKVTRTLSTTMGSLWERLAAISPYSVNPEAEFSLAIRGIDLISKNFDTGDIEYQQLKTQKNTLTGSQRGRSVSELIIHEHPVFCACFSTKGAWTFNHADIPRVAGEEFWARIGIDYDTLLNKATNLVTTLETKYISLL